jgi:hypothetical protein
MDEKTNTTVRIDMESHRALKELARRWSALKGVHCSLVDVVRMGIALTAKSIDKEEANGRRDDY